MPRKRGEYKKDNPLTKARANATRRTVGGKRVYPSHPDYPHPEVSECWPRGVLAGIRRKREVLYGKADKADSQAVGGFIYVVRNKIYSGVVKVGRSQDPETRLANALTFVFPLGSLELVDMFYCTDAAKAERLAHKAIEFYSVGREWFNCGEERALHAAWEAAKRVNLEGVRG